MFSKYLTSIPFIYTQLYRERERTTLSKSNTLNLNGHVLRQLLNSKARASRLVSKELGVFLVHLIEVGHISEEDRNLEDLLHARASLLDNSLDVLAAETGLLRDGTLNQNAVLGKGDLTGEEDLAVDFDGLRVGADGLGGASSVDDVKTGGHGDELV